jgi:hypothetical protein
MQQATVVPSFSTAARRKSRVLLAPRGAWELWWLAALASQSLRYVWYLGQFANHHLTEQP